MWQVVINYATVTKLQEHVSSRGNQRSNVTSLNNRLQTFKSHALESEKNWIFYRSLTHPLPVPYLSLTCPLPIPYPSLIHPLNLSCKEFVSSEGWYLDVLFEFRHWRRTFDLLLMLKSYGWVVSAFGF